MKLILPNEIALHALPRLHAEAPDCAVVQIDDDGVADGDLSDADVLLRWWLPNHVFRTILAQAPHLRWVHTPSAGVDHLLIPEIMRPDLVLTNSAGAQAIPIAEFVLMFALTHVKRAREMMQLTSMSSWMFGDSQVLDELTDKTMLIIGLGSIGEEIAKRATAFGLRVVGSRRHPRPMPGVAQVVGEGQWRELLPEADFVVIAAPLTDATRGMLDGAAFAAVKPGAYLINIARGQIVDTDALLDALHTGRLAGAALDALPIEPLPNDHPLWQAPNVWITPHISHSSPRTRGRILEIFFENLRRYRAGEPLRNVVDKQAGY